MGYTLAILANYSGLILSLWLGVYLVTRRARAWLAWSSGLMLWSLGGLLANGLYLMQGGNPSSGWLQGWMAGLALFFWYQTTLLVMPRKWMRWERWMLRLVYAVGLVSLVTQLLTPRQLDLGTHDPLMVDNQSFQSLYGFYAGFFMLLCGLSLYNIIETRRLSTSFITRRQSNMLLVCGLLTGLATTFSIIGAIPGQVVPAFWISGLIICAIICFGIAVIRYSAILSQRVLWRDMVYSAVSTGLAAGVYILVFAWLVKNYQVPPAMVAFLIPLVTLSHSLTEEIGKLLERLIFDRRTRELRQKLSRLGQLAVEQADMGAVLSRTLETICAPLHATYAVLLLFEQEQALPTGSFRWRESKLELKRADFEADSVQQLQPGNLPDPFFEITLLVPLHTAQEQIGALLVGRPENGIHYSGEDLLLLESLVDQLTRQILHYRRINQYLDQVALLPMQPDEAPLEVVPTAWVEDALQNISDYAYLGDSPLARLKQVEACLGGAAHTYVDTGKAVQQVIAGALEKLHPTGALPSGFVPREWFPYLILHEAYFKGLPNREITARLYISEGTFHRTRRSALRSVARMLSEMEMNCK